MPAGALEARVGAHATRDNWLHAFWQLIRHLRWGVGAHWAPRYDTDANTATKAFVENIAVTGPLHWSDAVAKLSPLRLILPPRVEISPTIHELIGHDSNVQTASFSPDGQKVVSASSDKTVRVWSSVTGDLQQTLEGQL